ncbi:acyl-CoA-binding domain-containing protein 5 [Capsella rubella]|uniref:acyl-CoA-binding domain-containing protein 5 n=1 Tax=Capsella rubella TaxID=81985 RepID=UPI000CD50A56|nr:acyl-CoA-binding domain-containing protein 5 [Capsella rubella]XP_023637397.1 acyl-CoA-binding domain-containing protein 5 [Capsella rubella]XP_023637398.1 acyl-CoA-binding domain-containing protein 5 [Capsella rubella]
MFSFSKRRMRLGRVKKVQLAESVQGYKSPLRTIKRADNSSSEAPVAATSYSDEHDFQPSSGNSENWMVVSVGGDKPAPRFNHAAAAIGNKMIVVGGESSNGLLDDVQVLNFDTFTWSTASSKVYLSPSSLPLKIPSWKGHCLVSWGKKVLLVGGKTDPCSDRVSVWAFDTDSECWSLMDAKGDLPVSRNGHTVVRASSVLILFGGEDSKKRKLNDLHMFDLKSSTWLPLNCTGTRPCARSHHVATLFDDKILFVFGGSGKNKTLNDLYSLDFETMVWSRIKIRGFHPSPRAGSCGVLCGTKWYITGGGSRKKRHAETLVFDILKVEWSVENISSQSSITSNKGFSLVLLKHKDKDFLVAFGGTKKDPSNQVGAFIVDKNKSESPTHPQTTSKKNPGRLLFGKRSSPSAAITSDESVKASSQRLIDSVARQKLASAIEEHGGSGRRSLSDIAFGDHRNPSSGNVSLRKQFSTEEEYRAVIEPTKCSEDEVSLPRTADDNNGGAKITAEKTLSVVSDHEVSNLQKQCSETFPLENVDGALIFQEMDNINFTGSMSSSSVYQFHEAKMTALIRRNGILEGQLEAALAGREAAERNVSVALRSKQETDKKLSDAMRDVELLKEKLTGLELAQEEANSLSNMVHSDNVRLEHDVAFLKAVLDDTQKELHSTRGVLAGERARAFQLQVEVFHLKQRLQSLENRAATPRKPFHV